MTKKLIILIFVLLAFLFISNVSFAANTVQDVTNGVAHGVENLMQDVQNGVSNAGNVLDETVNGTENTITDMGTLSAETINGAATTTNRTVGAHNDNYTATRTDAPFMDTTTSNLITWIVLAIAAVVIISLVWYYSSQTSNTER